MRMENIIIILVVGLIVGLAIGYIYKAKKRGAMCIGCSANCKCSGSCDGCSGCDAEK